MREGQDKMNLTLNKMMFSFFILLFLCTKLHPYTCNVTKEEQQPKHNQTLTMIGDSITWSREGQLWRCLLDNKGLHYDFAGNYLDDYGYRHEGYGGDTTFDVLKRIKRIKKSNAYFILLGVNDAKFNNPQQTYNNLILIAEKLNKINKNSKIYISTLLPVDNEFNLFNDSVNYLLLNNFNCTNCIIINLGGYFQSRKNWDLLLLDKVHPNRAGYELMSDYLVDVIK